MTAIGPDAAGIAKVWPCEHIRQVRAGELIGWELDGGAFGKAIAVPSHWVICPVLGCAAVRPIRERVDDPPKNEQGEINRLANELFSIPDQTDDMKRAWEKIARHVLERERGLAADLRDLLAMTPEAGRNLTAEKLEAVAGRPEPYPSLGDLSAPQLLERIRFWFEAEARYRYLWADAMLAARAMNE